jgi:hypothetical protein
LRSPTKPSFGRFRCGVSDCRSTVTVSTLRIASPLRLYAWRCGA